MCFPTSICVIKMVMNLRTTSSPGRSFEFPAVVYPQQGQSNKTEKRTLASVDGNLREGKLLADKDQLAKRVTRNFCSIIWLGYLPVLVHLCYCCCVHPRMDIFIKGENDCSSEFWKSRGSVVMLSWVWGLLEELVVEVNTMAESVS